MSIALLVLLAVTAILAAAWLTTDLLLRRCYAAQDLVWRATLVAVACVPFVIWAQSAMPDGLLTLPLLATPRAELVLEPADSRESMPNEQVPFPISSAAPQSDLTITPLPPAVLEESPIDAAAAPSASDQENSAASQWDFARLACCLVVGAWAGGASVGMLVLAIGAWSLRRLVRNARPVEGPQWRARLSQAAADAGLRKPLRTSFSDAVSSPVVVGFFRPVVLLPAENADEFSDTSLREVLLHEATHIARGDQWTNLLLQVVATLWWPHPLVHQMRRRISWLRELMCDALVISRMERTHYAQTLLQLACRSSSPRPFVGQLAVEPRPGALESRIASVLSNEAGRRLRFIPNSLRRSIWALLTLILCGAGTVRFVPAAAAPPQVEPPATANSAQADTTPSVRTVSGQVLSPDGEPAAQATVYLLANPQQGYFTLPVRTQSATTDADGRFTFESVKSGGYRLWAEKGPYTTLHQKLKGHEIRVGNGELEPVQLRLHEGCAYRVTVLSAETGKPVPDAHITFGWTDIQREYRTNQQGIAEIRGLARDDWYFVIKAEGYAMEAKKIPPRPLGSQTELEFRLSPGSEIRGVVKDEQGKPLAGVEVSADDATISLSPTIDRVVTGEDGGYILRNIPRGTPVRILTDKEGYKRRRQELTLAPNQAAAELNIVTSQETFAGDGQFTVLDENGTPIAGATLINSGKSSADIREGTTDKDGRCKLQDLYSSYRGVTVVAKAPGFIAERFAVQPEASKGKTGQTLRLRKGKTLQGKLVDPQGNPVKDVRVYFNQGENGDETGGRVDTDEQGRFRIDGLPDPSVLTVYTPSQYAPIEDVPVDILDSGEYTITLRQEGVIMVRAVDAKTRQPLPEYNVKVNFTSDRKQGDPSMSLNTTLIDQGINVLGPDGHYRLGHLLPGLPLQVMVSAEGYDPVVLRQVEAIPADEAKPLVVAMAKIDPSSLLTVAGTLLNSAGQPVAGANVRLIVGKHKPDQENWPFYHWQSLSSGDVKRHEHCLQFLTTATDRDGRFSFKEVKATPWLELFHTGGGVAPSRYPDLRSTTKDLSRLSLQAPNPAMLTFEVDRKKSPDVGGIQLEAIDWLEGRTAFASDFRKLERDQTTISFSDLPPGQYRVSLMDKPEFLDNGGFRLKPLQSETLDVEPGQHSKFSFE